MATTELGAALRRWRGHVSPQAVGLSAGGRRRAAGLRREELSQLAGISADYIIRLEQGRATKPSPQIAELLGEQVPDSAFRTPLGLLYLRARGRHHHAAGRFHEALDDFETIGRTVAAWGLDLPAVLPWHADAAPARLCLGQSAAAQKLALEQLRRVPASAVSARASALRVLAACAEPVRQVALLGEAADLLRDSRDYLELARVLTDLGGTHHRLGNFARAGALQREAAILAERAGADPRSLSFFGTRQERYACSDRHAPSASVSLNRAERRVAALAAGGCTNRQIAEQFSVTVGTVEQHLTRVYRKLRMSRRSDLATTLGLGMRVD